MNQRISRYMAVPAAALLIAACGQSGDQEVGEVSMDTTVAMADPDEAQNASAAEQPQSPDHQFLRQMSDHHVGLIQMAQQAAQRAPQDTVKKEAQHFHAGHTNDLQQMQRMLQERFSDSHQPTIMPRHAAMADSLAQQQGPEYGHTFIQNVIEHHREGVRMIDEYLPRATDQNVKTMAEKMKTVQQKDITRLEALHSSL